MPRLALIQMRVEGGQPEANLRRARERIAAAAEGGADIVVLPEAMNLGWTHPSARELAEPAEDGPTFRLLSEAARHHRVWICAGLVERHRDQIFNAALLIDSHGERRLLYRKLHELDLAREFYQVGDRLGVVETPWGRVGVMICADAFAPGQVISRTLGWMGARLILSPCAWAVPADHDPLAEPYGQLWEDHYGPVAQEFGLWIAGVSNVGPLTAGPWRGRRCIGCSLLVGPDGRVVLRGPYGEDADTILQAECAFGGGRPPVPDAPPTA